MPEGWHTATNDRLGKIKMAICYTQYYLTKSVLEIIVGYQKLEIIFWNKCDNSDHLINMLGR